MAARIALAVVVVATLLPTPAVAAPLRGTLKLPAKFKHPPLFKASGFWKYPNNVLNTLPSLVDPRRSMIVLLMTTDKGVATGTRMAPTLQMVDSRFDPPVLPAKPGVNISFVNKEKHLHLLDAGASFSGIRVGPGDRVVQSFAKKGAYRVRCSEMPHMIATVLVTPHLAVVPDSKGQFTFADVKPGEYWLRVWYRGKTLHLQRVTVRGRTTTLEIQLPLPAQKKKKE